jgi:HSP20 family molecular chaperone IbpA
VNVTPGTSGVLSPFSKLSGLYFNDSNEPDDFMFKFKQELKEGLKQEGVQYIDINVENKVDYYRILHELESFTNDNIKVYATSRNKFDIRLEEDSIETVDEEDDINDVEEQSEGADDV